MILKGKYSHFSEMSREAENKIFTHNIFLYEITNGQLSYAVNNAYLCKTFKCQLPVTVFYC